MLGPLIPSQKCLSNWPDNLYTIETTFWLCVPFTDSIYKLTVAVVYSKLYLPFKVRPKCQVKSVQYGFCTSGLTCEKKQHVPRLVNFLLIFVTKMTTKEMKIAKNCLKMLRLLNILFFVQKGLIWANTITINTELSLLLLHTNFN